MREPLAIREARETVLLHCRPSLSMFMVWVRKMYESWGDAQDDDDEPNNESSSVVKIPRSRRQRQGF